MFCMDDMVPQNHMLRLIDKAINWNFIYELVEEKYSPDNGRPSMDPVMLIKIPFIQYLYGIKSMRQTIKEIEGKCCISMVSWILICWIPYHIFYVWKELYTSFKIQILLNRFFKDFRRMHEIQLVDTEHILWILHM